MINLHLRVRDDVEELCEVVELVRVDVVDNDSLVGWVDDVLGNWCTRAWNLSLPPRLGRSLWW
jgi:hypothetical protein